MQPSEPELERWSRFLVEPLSEPRSAGPVPWPPPSFSSAGPWPKRMIERSVILSTINHGLAKPPERATNQYSPGLRMYR